MSSVSALIGALALLVSTNALPEPPPPEYLGEPTRKPKLTGTEIAAKRAQDIARAEKRLSALKAEKQELDKAVKERNWYPTSSTWLPAPLQRAVDANAAAIADTEALLSRLRSSPQVPPGP